MLLMKFMALLGKQFQAFEQEGMGHRREGGPEIKEDKGTVLGFKRNGHSNPIDIDDVIYGALIYPSEIPLDIWKPIAQGLVPTPAGWHSSANDCQRC